MDFSIAPFKALRFDLGHGAAAGKPAAAGDLVAPPYDIISKEEHARLLGRSPSNIVRLTLGDRPGEKADYRQRGDALLEWKRDGILREDPVPGFYVYGCSYAVPGLGTQAYFRGLIALGKLFPFADKVVLPHEKTFDDVVDDRYRLLDATRTHLELIFLLYEDREKSIDAILESESRGPALFEAPGKPGEIHSLWKIDRPQTVDRLRELFRRQKPIIADGHHRYTTSLLYRQRNQGHPQSSPGMDWQPMVFGNLVGDGLSILATHRLADCGGKLDEALRILEAHLEPAAGGGTGYAGGGSGDFLVETRKDKRWFRIPAAVRSARKGVAATDYALLETVVLQEWLAPLLKKEAGGAPLIRYFKEGSGEREALEKGEGDLLFRMRPVSPNEFRSVVDGGEVFPHKTTFFYPKIWSGLILWTMAEPGPGKPADSRHP